MSDSVSNEPSNAGAVPNLEPEADAPIAPPTPVPLPRMQAREGGVNVRMYRQGLGDAFLLAFDKGNGDLNDPVYVLIDCGVILGTPTPEEPLAAVIENIIDSTGGQIDLLVISHKHWDHVGSFQQLPDLWRGLKVDAVWMAWTEDPQDALGVQLKQDFKNDLDALCLAVSLQGQEDTPFASLVGLFGAPNHIVEIGLNGLDRQGQLAFGTSTHVGMVNARSLTAPENVKYLKPGMALELPHTDASPVRTYVLGPPRDVKLLKNINPSKRDPQTYSNPEQVAFSDGPGLAPNEKSAFTLALRARNTSGMSPFTPDEEYVGGMCLPFEGYQAKDWTHPEAHLMYPNYFEPTEEWRKIDNDWLSVGGELALQMDSYTNNTSLALAFELKNGDVLLFPADAQVGNWISWDSITPPMTNQAGLPVTAESLLARTKLYKVGHHGSHNATMRAVGLERMTSPDLVALLPVDEQIAHDVKNWHEMPFSPLLARLYLKTEGRVIRADQGVVTRQKPEFLLDAEWQTVQPKATKFAESVRVSDGSDNRVRSDLEGRTSLYYEVSIPNS